MTPSDIQFLQESFAVACKHVRQGGLWIPITLDDDEGVIFGEPASFADIVRSQPGGAYDSQLIPLRSDCFGEQSEAVVFEPAT